MLDAANGVTGTTNIQGGVLEIANAAALARSAVTIEAGARLEVATAARAEVADLAIRGVVDVQAAGLTTRAGMADADVRAAIRAGRGAGDWRGATGVSSSTAAAACDAGDLCTLGWIRDGAGSVTFAFAAPGDTDLDGVMDVLDAANVMGGQRFDSGLPATWTQGDFNHDAVVDVLDIADFVSAGLFDGGNYLPASAALSPVPEPGTGVFGVGCLLAAFVVAVRRR